MSSQRYSPEFKDEAVIQILDRRYSVPEVAGRRAVMIPARVHRASRC
jgi:transposase-like protein